MGKFKDLIDIETQVKKEYPRPVKESFFDLLSIGAIVGWTYVPVEGMTQLIGYMVLIGYAVIRYQNYKEWKDKIDRITKQRLNKK